MTEFRSCPRCNYPGGLIRCERCSLEAAARDLGGYGSQNIEQFLRGDFSCAAPEDVSHLKNSLSPQLRAGDHGPNPTPESS